MTSPPAQRTPTNRSPSALEAPVVVAARMQLIAQTVATVLDAAGIPSRRLVWDGSGRRAVREFDGAAAVVLLDPLESHLDLAQARRLVDGLVVPCVVLTEASPGPAWGALLVSPGVVIRSSQLSREELISDLRALIARKDVAATPHRAPTPAALVSDWERWVVEVREAQARLSRLSARETEVLGLLADGWRVPEIAGLLEVAEGTVRGQVKSMRAKLGVGTQLAAVALLTRYGDALPELVGNSPFPVRASAAGARRPGAIRG